MKQQADVNAALGELEKNIYQYADAANPYICREHNVKIWDWCLDCFRPSWKRFSVIVIGCGLAGAISAQLTSGCSLDVLHTWVELSLKITIPVFTVGISLIALARAIGEGNKFNGEYLNESCKLVLFSRMASFSVLCGIVGYLVSTIGKIPININAGICVICIGMAVDCVMMLAFVVCKQ